MIIDFDQPILDASGKPVAHSVTDADGKQTGGSPATLASTCAAALFAVVAQDQALSAENKFKMGMLGLQLAKGGKHQLPVEDIALLKSRIALVWGPMIIARAWPKISMQRLMRGARVPIRKR